MKTALCLVAILAGFLVVGEMDYQDAVQREVARLEWAKEKCLDLARKESAWVSKRSDGSISCAKYKGANLAFMGNTK